MEKRDIAVKQIKAAARHYNKGDYICSITLSGAAEEILGRIAKKRTKTNQLEGEIIYLRSVYFYFSGQNLSDKELIKKINKVKNELKHNDNGDNEWVDADFEYEAAMLFIKAMKNYFDCYKEFPNDKIANGLFDHLTL
ncbi:MAG: hypothetical protein ABR968_13735 [Bacteroidales bacterium]